MATCEANGPCSITWAGAFERLDRLRRLEILNGALRHEEQSGDYRNRKQDIKRAARDVDPEVADGLRGVPRESANQGDGDRDSDRGRHEVLNRERGHLRQVAHRRFRRVGLPVGVGHEADGGVEGQVRRHRRGEWGRLGRGKLHGIQRQMALQPLQQVDEQKAEDAQRNHGGRVADPRLLLVLADSAKPIDQPLQWAKNGVKKCSLALEDTVHERAHGLGDRQHNTEKNQYLRNTDPSHFSTSKLLRPKQRVHQINEQSRRHDSRNGVFHGILLKTLRRFRKTPEQDEKRNDDSDIENVQQHNHLAKTGCSETRPCSRIDHNYAMALGPKRTRHPAFRRGPPAFSSADHDHGIRPENLQKSPNAIPAEI